MFSGLVRNARSDLGKLWWIWILVLTAGIVTNFGTAALRIPLIMPMSQPLDFASFYGGAWALRQGSSPYFWSPEFLDSLAEDHGMAVRPTPPMSPPFWIWLCQLFTALRFPVAAILYLALLIAVMIACTSLLVRIAGHPGWKMTMMVLPFTISFGPTFLNLTIGQNAPFVLLGALVLGRYLQRERVRGHAAAAGWIVAVATKIYPVMWLAAMPFIRRWRAFALMLGTAVLVFGGSWLLMPDAHSEYWFRFAAKRGSEVTSEISIDDQSLWARVMLLATTRRIGFHDMGPLPAHEKVWQPPVEMQEQTVNIVTILILLGMVAAVVAAVLRADTPRHTEGLLYLTVLLSLLPMPHMERYNHVALLAPMAWLWARGGGYRRLTILAYCLVGMSRLNHLWARLFEWPLGPLATGTCTWAIIIMGAAIVICVMGQRRSEYGSHLEDGGRAS